MPISYCVTGGVHDVRAGYSAQDLDCFNADVHWNNDMETG